MSKPQLPKRPELGKLGSLFAVLLFGNQPNVIRIVGTAARKRMVVVILSVFETKLFPLISGVRVELSKEFRLSETPTFYRNVSRSALVAHCQDDYKNHDHPKQQLTFRELCWLGLNPQQESHSLSSISRGIVGVNYVACEG